VIRTFRTPDTEKVFRGERTKQFQQIRKIAERKLMQLHAAETLTDMRVPPGNSLEALTGKRKGQHSIRINDQYRICFVWRNGDSYDVEITDYH
jgi:proteic killer suppression protein